MLETVILKSLGWDMEGVIEYSYARDALKLRYSIKWKRPNAMLKLMLASSVRPNNEPVVADTLEFKGNSAVGEKHITSSNLAYNGYRTQDIDTFVVVKADKGTYTPLSGAFARLYWDVCFAFSKAGTSQTDQSILNARTVLESIKRNTTKKGYEGVCKELSQITRHFKSSKHSPLPCMKWYELKNASSPLEVGAYEHILTPDAKEIIEKGGFPLLFGVGDNALTAFAAKSTEKNPFQNALDCSLKIGDFYVVGVQFKDDGQYFVKPE